MEWMTILRHSKSLAEKKGNSLSRKGSFGNGVLLGGPVWLHYNSRRYRAYFCNEAWAAGDSRAAERGCGMEQDRCLAQENERLNEERT